MRGFDLPWKHTKWIGLPHARHQFLSQSQVQSGEWRCIRVIRKGFAYRCHGALKQVCGWPARDAVPVPKWKEASSFCSWVPMPSGGTSIETLTPSLSLLCNYDFLHCACTKHGSRILGQKTQAMREKHKGMFKYSILTGFSLGCLSIEFQFKFYFLESRSCDKKLRWAWQGTRPIWYDSNAVHAQKRWNEK